MVQVMFQTLAMLFSTTYLYQGGTGVPVNAYTKTQNNRSVDVSVTIPTSSWATSEITFGDMVVLNEETNQTQLYHYLDVLYDTDTDKWHFSYNVYSDYCNVVMYYEVLGGSSSNGSFITTYISPTFYEFYYVQDSWSLSIHTPNDFSYTRIVCHLEVYPSELLGGYENGYATGYNDGKNDGIGIGQEQGYEEGLVEGKNIGRETGYQDGLHSNQGYNAGYLEGYNAGLEHSTRDYGIVNLMTSIADTPIMMMRSLFDFSIFGTGVLTVVLSLFTALIVIHLLKRVIK